MRDAGCRNTLNHAKPSEAKHARNKSKGENCTVTPAAQPPPLLAPLPAAGPPWPPPEPCPAPCTHACAPPASRRASRRCRSTIQRGRHCRVGLRSHSCEWLGCLEAAATGRGSCSKHASSHSHNHAHPLRCSPAAHAALALPCRRPAAAAQVGAAQVGAGTCRRRLCRLQLLLLLRRGAAPPVQQGGGQLAGRRQHVPLHVAQRGVAQGCGPSICLQGLLKAIPCNCLFHCWGAFTGRLAGGSQRISGCLAQGAQHIAGSSARRSLLRKSTNRWGLMVELSLACIIRTSLSRGSTVASCCP